jgi:signal transduction histidine kinase
LRSSLLMVLSSGAPHTMAVQKYSIKLPGEDEYTERYWTPINSPIWNNTNTEIKFILHRVEDVTEFVRASQQSQSASTKANSLQERVGLMEADILRRTLELQEASNHLRGIVDATTDLIVSIDTSFRCTVCNKAMQEYITTVADRRLNVGSNMLDIIANLSDANVFVGWWKRVLAGERFTITENLFGLGHWWEFNFNPILNNDGVIIGACHHARDVTERIQLEQTLRAAKVEAEAAVAMKTRFFANISHEFRTPLTLIMGPVDDSLADRDNPLAFAQRQRMMLIHNNALRLLKLVNSLLDFSRLEARCLKPVFEEIDLGPFTSLLCDEFRFTIEKAGLKFIVDTPSFPEHVYVDKEMWEKITFNLLSNAFKFTLSGCITVSLTHHSDHLELSVQDTGAGIPPASLNSIFERFNRVEESPARSFEGSGIGLALVYELAQQHGGSVRVHSRLGEGSNFIVCVPFGHDHVLPDQLGAIKEGYHLGAIGVAYASEAIGWVDGHQLPVHPISSSDDEEVAAKPFQTVGAITAQPPRVLFVDDNADMRLYVTSLLVSQGWFVEVAENGQLGFEAAIAASPRFDLVLTDVMMPVMNGTELLKALRADARTRTIPVVMVSARSGEDAMVRGLKMGAEDYLYKPFAAKELLARARSQIELGRMRTHLEDLVAQRTLELERTHAELQLETKARYEAQVIMEESKARAAEIHRQQLENLVDTICHEIRNPLNGIFGSVDAIKSALLSIWGTNCSCGEAENSKGILHEVFDSLTVIDECATHQKSLVDDVLDLSSIEADAVVFISQPFSPKAVFDNVLKMFKQEIAKKQLQLIANCDPNMEMLIGDSRRLSQILINLISNAVKFTQRGSVTVNMNLSPRILDGSAQLNISVTDTGVGISDDDQNKLFNRFSQGSRRVGVQYQGSGLGLAISRQLAERMNGTIYFTSVPGQGTTFHVQLKLPLAMQAPVQTSDSDNPNSRPGSSPTVTIVPGLEGRKALIVEDNLTNQKLLAKILIKLGVMNEVANHGREALDWVERNSFDFVLMDVQMPIMDGLEATRAIREREKLLLLAPVPIIGVSADARPEHQLMALKSGMDDYVTKPYHRETIMKVLLKWSSKMAI